MNEQNFKSAVIQAIKAKKTQSQFAQEIAATGEIKESTAKQQYRKLVNELKDAHKRALESNDTVNSEKLSKAISLFKFADGRKKENIQTTPKTVEQLTNWMSELETVD